MKSYTGIGSRKTPENVQEVFTIISLVLEEKGFIVRTGDADGADHSFRKKTKNKKVYTANDAKKKDFHIAERIHPNWQACSEYAKKLHTRNLYQVKGDNLDEPSEFLLCWTKEGKPIGGSRTAIVYAQENQIPVFNFGDHKQLEKFIKFLYDRYKIKL